MMVSNCLRCQIVRCVKLSAVSNRPLCQIVLGVKLSYLPSWCQIVLLAFLVSNCPRCQIILSPKGTILMLDLFERRRRKKAYVPDFIRGIKERAICLREPSFLPSSLNCIFFFLHVCIQPFFCPHFCLLFWVLGRDACHDPPGPGPRGKWLPRGAQPRKFSKLPRPTPKMPRV